MPIVRDLMAEMVFIRRYMTGAKNGGLYLFRVHMTVAGSDFHTQKKHKEDLVLLKK